MKQLSRIAVTLIVALNFLAAGAALPAVAKTCPCCAKAEAGDTGTTGVREPMDCCKVKGAAPSESVTLNTGTEEFHNYLTVSQDETAPSFTSFAPQAPKPDFARWAFESPPVYIVNSTFIC